MSKPSDLRNKLGGVGATGAGGAKPNPFAPPPTDANAAKATDPNVRNVPPVKGHDPAKGAHKTLGGAGSAGGRPKV